MKYNNNIMLELNSNKSDSILYAHQGDKDSRFITATITCNGEEVELTDITATADAVVDDIIVAQDVSCEISSEENTILIPLTENMLSLSGILQIDVKLSDTNGAIVTAQTFFVNITKSVINSESKVKPEGTPIGKIITEIENARGEYKDLSEMLNNSYCSKTDLQAVSAELDKKISNTPGAVTTEIIASGAVTTDKIANESVTTDKLAYQCVTIEEIADGAVTEPKLDPELLALINGKANATDLQTVSSQVTANTKALSNVYTKSDIKSRFAQGISAIYDSAGNIVKATDLSTLSGGALAGDTTITTAFIANNVTHLQSGCFAGCTNLTTVYIDNIQGKITVDSGAIPGTATVIYTDEFNPITANAKAILALRSSIGDINTALTELSALADSYITDTAAATTSDTSEEVQ